MHVSSLGEARHQMLWPLVDEIPTEMTKAHDLQDRLPLVLK